MPDYLFLMESRLHPARWQVIVQVQQAAESLGVNLYLVGGAVRDLIGGFPIEDLDFVVEGKALKLVPLLTRQKARVLSKNDALQSAELEFPIGIPASVSMARAASGSKGSKARAVPATILEDLRRRDFSVNAIGISLNPQSRGLLLDPTNGVADMEKKELRALHLYSFVEEPIRLLRGVRFRTRLKYTFEPKTAAQFEDARENKLLEKIAPEDLGKEVQRIGREQDPAEILKALDKEKLLVAVSPRLQGPRLDWKGMASAAKARQMLAASGIQASSYPLFLHLLTRKLPPRDRAQVAKRLKLNKEDAQAFRKLPDAAKRLAKDIGGKAGATPTKLYELLSNAQPELILLVLLENSSAKIQSRVRNYLRKYLPMRYKLPETELQALGIAEGTPRYQKLLEQFFHAMLEGKVRTKTDYAKLLKKLVQTGTSTHPPSPQARARHK
jgi:tRNA nucleotidyltransferase (CCA-adding enzyme)